jgi:hypothetical protein
LVPHLLLLGRSAEQLNPRPEPHALRQRPVPLVLRLDVKLGWPLAPPENYFAKLLKNAYHRLLIRLSIYVTYSMQ